ncbi:MAG: O-antigen ligase family protein [Candidatus Sulfotelmatobacter sp.]
MSAVAQRTEHLHSGLLGLVAAVFAVSLSVVTYQGPSAPGYALAGVGILALLVLALLIYARPLVTLAIALMFLTSPAPLLLSLQNSALVSGFLLGGAILAFVVRTPFRSMARDPLFLPVGMFALFGIGSSAYGLLVGNEISYVLGDCFQIIEFAAVYFLVALLLNDFDKVRMTLKLLLVSILITILLELVLFALGPDAGNLLPSWNGSFADESIVRTIDIDATILFAVLINLYPTARSRRQRLWIGLALIPTVANIALSLSRGLWLCTVVAAVLSLILQSRNVRMRLFAKWAVVGVGLVVVAGAWKIGSDSDVSLLSILEERVFYGVSQVEEGFAGTDSMATRRFLEMAIVGPQVLAEPWIGHGLGATYVIGGYAVLDAGTSAPIDNHFIHNLYLVTAFRMGLIGLGLLLWLLFRYFRTVLRASKALPAGIPRALVVGFVASVAGQLFLSITQPTVTDHPTCALIACAMALSFRLVAINSSVSSGVAG